MHKTMYISFEKYPLEVKCAHVWDNAADASFSYSARFSVVLYVVTVLLEYLTDCFIRVSQCFVWRRVPPVSPLGLLTVLQLQYDILYIPECNLQVNNRNIFQRKLTHQSW